MGRAPCCDKANVKKGPWSPEEDAKLKAYIDKYGTGGNWIALPQKVGLKRCGKSCRLRWLNYLRPNIKHGGFTEEEDNIICSLYISIGSRWSIIAAQLPGRTDNDIKNYWNTRLKKKLLGRRKQSNTNRASIPGQGPNNDSAEEDQNSFNLQNLSSSALERLQLHMHLQTLQNPLSFYNNPVLWPMLNPLQQKMIQTLHSNDQNINQTHQIVPSSPDQPAPLSLNHHQQDYSPLSNSKTDEALYENSLNGFSSSGSSFGGLNTDKNNNLESRITKQINVGNPIVSGFTQAELDDLINNKCSAFVPAEDTDHDCFRDMDRSKDDILAWWSNEFDVQLSESLNVNSWDSAIRVRDQPEEMYRDYAVGSYSMHS